MIYEVQDHTKTTRSQYLPLMEAGPQEDPDDAQICFWLGRDMWGNQHERSAELLQRYLSLPTSTWGDERSEAMRYLARMQPDKKMLWLDKARLEAPHRREIWLDLAEELHAKSDWLNLFWACTSGIERPSHRKLSRRWSLLGVSAVRPGRHRRMASQRDGPRCGVGKKALELDPGNQRLKNNLDFFIRRREEVREAK